jgi:putative endonuclease
MTHHLKLGQSGEDLAAEFLQQKGYAIRHRNYRFQRAEIDLIAETSGILVFVEVKTRFGNSDHSPEEAVDWKKEKMMVLGAEGYLEETGWTKDIRYDILTVILHDGGAKLTHIEDAFWPRE